MRKILFMLSLAAMTAMAQNFETADEAVKNIRVGWNLGNTFDSNSGDTLNMWIEHWTKRVPSDYETAWGQPVTKPELMKMLKEAGFNAIRVPVTWYPHMEAQFKFSTYENSIWHASQDDLGTKIQAAWMARVREVVDYVISQDMYCILNIHHDTGASNTAWLIADETVYSQQRARFEAVWRQIAEEFKDYDHRLIFEGYNEMLDIKRSWCFASFAASGSYNASIAKSAYNAINSYAQSFVDAVRSTGGNSRQRNLIVSTYGACDGSGTWNAHLKDPLKNLTLPKDAVSNHLIMEVHSYPDVQNLTSLKKDVDERVSAWKTYMLPKGAPLIIGEWGTSTEDAYSKYRSNMIEFYRYFVEQTKAAGIKTFHWMGLTDGNDRSVPRFNQPDLVSAIMKGYYGEAGYTGIDAPTLHADALVDVYSMSGVCLYRNVKRAEAEQTLSEGIYIIDGKKVVIDRK